MTKRTFASLIAAVVLLLPLSKTASAQAQPSNSVWWSSQILPFGDGVHATAICSMSARDPNTQIISTFATDYAGFSVVCVVTRASDGSVVTSSLDPGNCPVASDDTSPDLGNIGNPTAICTIRFPVQQGETYVLTTTNYIFLYPGGPSPAPQNGAPISCVAGLLYDPLGLWDLGAYNYNFPNAGPQETPGLSISNPKYACLDSPSLTISDDGEYSDALQSATTYANFAAISIDPPATQFFQTQYQLFQSDLGAIQNVMGGSDTLNWCIQGSNSNCGTVSMNAVQGGFDGANGSQSVTGGGNDEAFYAPTSITGATIVGPTLTMPSQQYVCVQDSSQTDNYACASAALIPFSLYISPPSVSLGLAQQQNQQFFTATANASTALPPANALEQNLSNYFTWYGWSLSGHGSGSQQGPPTFTGTSTQTSYLYLEPGQDAIDILSVSANVNMPYGDAISLSAQATINVTANLTSQTVGFDTIPAQTAASTLALSATASSGLPVSYDSTTPGICTVNGSTATLSAAGSCGITAEQTGSATYAAASTSQSFMVNFAAQNITFAAVPSVIAYQGAGTPLTLSATASSGLPVNFTSSTPSICTVSGAIASLLAPGTCTIQAAQAGNAA
jgi:hypothetical protein